jgi:hypothetical protein
MEGKMECKGKGFKKYPNNYPKTKEEKDRYKLAKPPRTEKDKNTRKQKQGAALKKAQNEANDLGEAFMQEGSGSLEKLNEHYKACQKAQKIAVSFAKTQKHHRNRMERRQDEVKRGEQDERSRKLREIMAARTERRRKLELKDVQKRARQADHGCGYPRQCIGKRGKTEADLFHEHYHVEKHPLEGEAYEQEKIDAALKCPTWFNRDFDNNSIPSTVGRMF